MYRRLLVLTSLVLFVKGEDGKLSLPVPEDCENRIKHAEFQGHNYFFSWEYDVTKNLTVNWLTARNICRRHCMDAVSIESTEENDFLKIRMLEGDGIRFFWTSGRKCNFDGCDQPHLQPPEVNGWFWSGSGVRMTSSDGRVDGDWSPKGGDGMPQPDNREFRLTAKNDEACLAVLNNYYGDGVKWHDIACYHRKPFVCEDQEKLLEYVRQTNPGIKL